MAVSPSEEKRRWQKRHNTNSTRQSEAEASALGREKRDATTAASKKAARAGTIACARARGKGKGQREAKKKINETIPTRSVRFRFGRPSPFVLGDHLNRNRWAGEESDQDTFGFTIRALLAIEQFNKARAG